jgi:hypothetical protein
MTSGVLLGITSSILAPIKAGAAIPHDAIKDAFVIGKKVLQSGLEARFNVATGTASLAGTALGGIVAAGAEMSGAVEGLDKLGRGAEAMNGLSIGAVRKVG